MINFFRKKRKNLAEDNEPLKYLRYAIGEILLIIIGVLIAITAAEWNSVRKNRINETKALKEIYKGLQNDQVALDKEILKTEKGIKNITILDSLLREDLPANANSLDTLFGAVYGFRFFRFEKTNYEDLKANNLNLIKSDSLRRQLIRVYESGYVRNEKNYDIEVWVNDMLRPYYLQNFHGLIFTVSATPNDYESLWKDSYYKNIVNYRLVFLNQVVSNSHKSLKTDIEILMRLIEGYIGI